MEPERARGEKAVSIVTSCPLVAPKKEGAAWGTLRGADRTALKLADLRAGTHKTMNASSSASLTAGATAGATA
jgi:hypothetical protein